MKSITMWAIKGENGFLKGNGTATFLRWYKEPYQGKLYKTKASAKGAVTKLSNRRDSVRAELYEVELVCHGTINDILEKEIL